MQDFINPKSMMTPGIAGATMMFIVNGIVFAFPELQPRIIALILSFLIGSIVFASKTNLSAAIWTKLVYWIVNSLIIFVVGFGSANFAASSTEQMQPDLENSSYIPSLISSAHAQGDNRGSATTSQDSAKPAKLNKAELTKQLELERRKIAELSEQLSRLQAEEDKDASKEPDEQAGERKEQRSPGFFTRW
ncbi:MAG: SNG1 family protein [Gammaproteobacteria bacterium]|nr:SNG1 family protein [Gammaproteobacteria bacterium]MBU1480184.1 SNG1 family protein [Gammaproteobacteria bacterium]